MSTPATRLSSFSSLVIVLGPILIVIGAVLVQTILPFASMISIALIAIGISLTTGGVVAIALRHAVRELVAERDDARRAYRPE